MQALVTGANGHLGLNLVSLLRARGHAVRASVRTLAPDKTAMLRSIPGVELAAADVRDEAQMQAALAGVDTLFHVAAVYSTTERGREGEILDSAIRGTEVALKAAARAGIRRVILTSSVVTLPLTAVGAAPVTEDDWATDLRIPYFRAKVESERLAWALAEQLSIELTTILPAGIIGPGFSRRTPTIDLIQACLMGEFRLGAPRGTFSLVDVRDVAAAHLLAFEKGATGRFIVGYDHIPSYTELVLALAAIDPKLGAPLLTLPTFVAPFLPLYDAMCHRLLGTPRIGTPDIIATLVSGKVVNFSCQRAKTVLGWRTEVPLPTSLADTVAALRTLH
ncbi:NAD-dependent epimerase/dehydratase family protein [Paucibacter soli]|uniref:NAD-dependent epimerase/dehydratase family protein n=1 Tax=Paucibacter soli TaxID=3133433 RepID=UPI0030A5DEAC